MNDVIVDHEIPTEVINLIRDSEKYVVIVSPYIDLWTHLTNELKSSIERGVIVQLYYRTKEVKPKTINELKKIGIELNNIDTLHSKLYLSENRGIMSSMNLYSFSSENSKEIGLITDERKLLNQYREYVEERLRKKPIIPKKSLFDTIKGGIETVIEMTDSDDKKSVEPPKTDFQRSVKNDSGYCIRCKDEIELNVKIPYCKKCYKSWNRYKDKKYVEKHCHDCGKSNKSTLLKPICYDCFKS
jgi:hypothetical protein